MRVAMPNYPLLLKELKQLEFVEPGKAPDHPLTDDGSKDVADSVAGVIGYLSVFGHGRLRYAAVTPITAKTVVELSGLPPVPDFSVEGDAQDDWDLDHLAEPIDFGIY